MLYYIRMLYTYVIYIHIYVYSRIYVCYIHMYEPYVTYICINSARALSAPMQFIYICTYIYRYLYVYIYIYTHIFVYSHIFNLHIHMLHTYVQTTQELKELEHCKARLHSNVSESTSAIAHANLKLDALLVRDSYVCHDSFICVP